MNQIAVAVKHLIAAGVTGDALVTAIDEMEQAAKPARTKAAERTARWREKKLLGETVTEASPTVTGDEKKEIPQTPLEKILPISKPIGARDRLSDTRGTRIPHDFAPAPHVLREGVNRGLTELEAADQAERFIDWARSATGPNSRKVDWQRALLNWLKRAADDKRHRQHGKFTGPNTPGKRLNDAIAGLEGQFGRGRAPSEQ